MIRFSAGLVVVAIGVLIGGVATSKLLLVYVAIAVSAVALLALAIGVVVKREELFGGGQGLVPAGAGAGPGCGRPSAGTGESLDEAAGGWRSVPPSGPARCVRGRSGASALSSTAPSRPRRGDSRP